MSFLFTFFFLGGGGGGVDSCWRKKTNKTLVDSKLASAAVGQGISPSVALLQNQQSQEAPLPNRQKLYKTPLPNEMVQGTRSISTIRRHGRCSTLYCFLKRASAALFLSPQDIIYSAVTDTVKSLLNINAQIKTRCTSKPCPFREGIPPFHNRCVHKVEGMGSKQRHGNGFLRSHGWRGMVPNSREGGGGPFHNDNVNDM